MYSGYNNECCINVFLRLSSFLCFLLHYSMMHMSLIIIDIVWVIMAKMGLNQPYDESGLESNEDNSLNL